MKIDVQSEEPVTLRAATIAEVERLGALIKAYYEFDRIAASDEEIRSGVTILLEDESLGQAWLVLHGTQPVGYTIFTYGFDVEFGGRLATITDLYLEPAWRGKGIGPKILSQVEAYCRTIGLKGLELQVERDNTEARGLYRKFGFKSADCIPMSKRIEHP